MSNWLGCQIDSISDYVRNRAPTMELGDLREVSLHFQRAFSEIEMEIAHRVQNGQYLQPRHGRSDEF